MNISACWGKDDLDVIQDLMAEHSLLFPAFQKKAAAAVPNYVPWQRAGQPFTDSFGCVWETAESGMTGAVVKHPLLDWALFPEYRRPSSDECDGWAPVCWETIRQNVCDARREGRLLNGGLRHGHTFLTLTYLRGYENLIFDMCDEHPKLPELIAMVEEFNLGIVKHYIDAGMEWMGYARTCAGMLGNVHVDPPNAKRERMPDPTLPELLRKQGYRTALIGKWHIDPQPRLVGFDKALYPMVAHRNYGQTVFDENATPRIVDVFLEDYFTEAVESFLGECKGRPFFLNYNISPPHQPIGPGHLPEQYVRMYSTEHIQLRPNTDLGGAKPPHDPTFWSKVYRSADYFWDYKEKRPIKPADDMLPEGFGLHELTALYYGAISCVDDYVGRLMDALERHGQLDRTIILFTSDHGDMLGSHGLFNKNRLFEEAIRIPFIIAGPNVTPSNPARFASLIDVAPTILDAAGLVPPAHMQGRALLRDGGADVAFIETGSAIGIRTATHLYGLSYDEKRRSITGDNCVLYDLEQDPYQQKNLAGLSANEQIETSLRERVLAWERDTPWMDSQRRVQ